MTHEQYFTLLTRWNEYHIMIGKPGERIAIGETLEDLYTYFDSNDLNVLYGPGLLERCKRYNLDKGLNIKSINNESSNDI
ncbi:MAG: hypothetical protein K0U41_08890 [Gammaproteobacteria bacterium]|nr:hypothetical protein [Gammaproteobacteria bacterium]